MEKLPRLPWKFCREKKVYLERNALLSIVSKDQYLNAATVSAHPTNPIQLSAAEENRSIQGLEDCEDVLYLKKRGKTGENVNAATVPPELI